MTSAPPHTSAPRAASDLRWSSVGLATAGLITVGYLTAHGVRGLIDLIAAAIAGLGLLAISVATPRIARDYVRRRMRSAPEASLGLPLAESPIRWLVPQIAGVFATSTMLIGSLSLANLVDGDRAAHAVALVVVAGNAVTLLGHLVPLPGFPGWSLLLVCLQLLGTRASRRTSLAATVGRIGVSLIAAFIIVVGVVARQPLLLRIAGPADQRTGSGRGDDHDDLPQPRLLLLSPVGRHRAPAGLDRRECGQARHGRVQG
jgi:hypothetical protein